MSSTTSQSQISEDVRPSTATPRVEITEKMYIKARDEVGRQIICMVNNLQHLSENATLDLGPGLAYYEFWTTESFKTNVAKLKITYGKIHSKRASLQLNNKPETISERKELIHMYSKVLKYLKKLEIQVPAELELGAEIITSTRSAQTLRRVISEDTLNWTRKRFRRVDYSLMHQIWRRLKQILKLVPEVTTEEFDPESIRDDKSICSNTSSLRTQMTGDHPSLAPSQISLENFQEAEVMSSEYSCWDWSVDTDDDMRTTKVKAKAKNKQKLPKTEPSDGAGITLGKFIQLPPDYMNYRNVDFAKCLLNSDCNCYHCYPLNIPEDDEEFNCDDQTDTIGILWDLKDCGEPTYMQSWTNMTEAERRKEDRFNHVLRNFEKAIQEAEDMTAANMLWDLCCFLSSGVLQFWNFMKGQKCRFRSERVVPIDYDLPKDRSDLNLNIGRGRSLGRGKGDYVAVPIE